MAVIRRTDAHPSLPELPTERSFEFLDLADQAGTYAAAAIGERPGCLELHLSVLRWGPKSARALRQDLDWLKNLARERGKPSIIGHTIAPGLEVDHLWFRFARAYGFTSQHVHQTAELTL